MFEQILIRFRGGPVDVSSHSKEEQGDGDEESGDEGSSDTATVEEVNPWTEGAASTSLKPPATRSSVRMRSTRGKISSATTTTADVPLTTAYHQTVSPSPSSGRSPSPSFLPYTKQHSSKSEALNIRGSQSQKSTSVITPSSSLLNNKKPHSSSKNIIITPNHSTSSLLYDEDEEGYSNIDKNDEDDDETLNNDNHEYHGDDEAMVKRKSEDPSDGSRKRASTERDLKNRNPKPIKQGQKRKASEISIENNFKAAEDEKKKKQTATVQSGPERRVTRSADQRQEETKSKKNVEGESQSSKEEGRLLRSHKNTNQLSDLENASEKVKHSTKATKAKAQKMITEGGSQTQGGKMKSIGKKKALRKKVEPSPPPQQEQASTTVKLHALLRKPAHGEGDCAFPWWHDDAWLDDTEPEVFGNEMPIQVEIDPDIMDEDLNKEAPKPSRQKISPSKAQGEPRRLRGTRSIEVQSSTITPTIVIDETPTAPRSLRTTASSRASSQGKDPLDDDWYRKYHNKGRYQESESHKRDRGKEASTYRSCLVLAESLGEADGDKQFEIIGVEIPSDEASRLRLRRKVDRLINELASIPARYADYKARQNLVKSKATDPSFATHLKQNGLQPLRLEGRSTFM